MRILSIQATSMWYHATQKTPLAEPITLSEDRMEECVVLFCCIEKLDEKNPDNVIASAARNIQKRLTTLAVNRVLIYPYAHLTSTLGSQQVALEILSGLEDELRAGSVEVKRAPFGWYKEFEIRGKVHPLADLSMTICPYEGTECDFTCPYCHHPFKEEDAVHICQQSTGCRGSCPEPE